MPVSKLLAIVTREPGPTMLFAVFGLATIRLLNSGVV